MTDQETIMAGISVLSLACMWFGFYLNFKAQKALKKAIETGRQNIREMEAISEAWALWNYGAKQEAQNLIRRYLKESKEARNEQA